MNGLKIFSLRHSIARGAHWQCERDCSAATAADWLAIFRNDEPGVSFIAALRAPRIAKGN